MKYYKKYIKVVELELRKWDQCQTIRHIFRKHTFLIKMKVYVKMDYQIGLNAIKMLA